MILCEISQAERYRAISPALADAIDWLRGHIGDEFVKGTKEIGNGIIVKSEETAMVPREKADLEAHRRFIDIHVPLKGAETIGWASRDSLKYPKVEYNPDTDIEFFGDEAPTMLHLKVGRMAVFFPEDAHAPNIGLGNHRKLCIKIPV